MKIQTILSAAVLTAILSTGASAQVVLLPTVTVVLQNATARFVSISENVAVINGYVEITAEGVSGGTTGTTTLTALENNSIVGTNLIVSSEGSAAGTSSTVDIDSELGASGVVQLCDVASAGGSSASGFCDFGGNLTFNDIAGGVTSVVTGTTTPIGTQNFASVNAVAMGAVTQVSQVLTQTPSMTISSGDASTTNTTAIAAFSQGTGSGIASFTGAYNNAEINGYVTAGLGAGNIGFNNGSAPAGATAGAYINTQAIGAMTTGTITASFVGIAPVAPGL